MKIKEVKALFGVVYAYAVGYLQDHTICTPVSHLLFVYRDPSC